MRDFADGPLDVDILVCRSTALNSSISIYAFSLAHCPFLMPSCSAPLAKSNANITNEKCHNQQEIQFAHGCPTHPYAKHGRKKRDDGAWEPSTATRHAQMEGRPLAPAAASREATYIRMCFHACNKEVYGCRPAANAQTRSRIIRPPPSEHQCCLQGEKLASPLNNYNSTLNISDHPRL